MKRLLFVNTKYFLAGLFLTSCFMLNGCGDPYQKALSQAGKNRKELKAVINHYRTTDRDSLKLEAAYFLIANMPGKYTLTVGNTEPYRAAIRQIGKAYKKKANWTGYMAATRQIIDSLQHNYATRYMRRPDIEVIEADYLIASIDSAFSRWRTSPWHDRYSFEAFCEWVLPYRTTHEELEDWRALAWAQRSARAEDSLIRQDSIVKLGIWLINDRWMDYGTEISQFPLPLSYSDMLQVRNGACLEQSEYATKLFRSRGIPAAMDLVPAWGNRSSAHAWNSIMLPNDSCQGVGFHPQGWLHINNLAPKIYRQSYAIQRNEILYTYRDTESIPYFFREFDKMDVTADYIPVSDVEVSDLKSTKSRIVWLSTFDNSSWVPVAYAERKGKKATFKNIGRGLLMYDNKPTAYKNGGKGIVYLPTYQVGGQAVVAADPLILHIDGTQQTLKTDTTRKQSITVSRKYPQHPSFEWYDSMMIGGRFEASNRPDFKDAVTLYKIEGLQEHAFPHHPIQRSKAYRYVRYCVRDGYNEGNVAELHFYSDSTLLSGRPIGTPGNHPTRQLGAAFDNNMLSWYESNEQNGVWVGLDLGTPQQITSIAYRARNDDNDIWPGDLYEMWYWDDGWQSLGQQTATGYALTWDNVPTGTLYLVRDLTKGVEQRIFTYQNGQITWW